MLFFLEIEKWGYGLSYAVTIPKKRRGREGLPIGPVAFRLSFAVCVHSVIDKKFI